MINTPTPKEKLTLRILIVLGLISILNFLYWFVQPQLIGDQLLFGLLIVPIVFDSLRMVYIWYHYWDISVPKKPTLTKTLTADVFTTYFPGEPYDMVQETLLAIQRIKYPHTTYLCDEANDPILKEFCLKHNIIHVTRNNRIDAKAGNINNALRQASGDICLILDPDHVPRENFLDEIVPYFEDDSIGFVQSVQAYYNIEESLVARGAAEQTFHFYGPVMMTMNSYGTVNAIGANCVFRRKALDSIGGHAAGLSEDMHTAMQLHAKGWKSIYVPEVFSKGLVPASLTAYYKQQLKWSRGTMELLVSVYPKLFKNFTWRQKVHYGVLPFHYLSGFIYMISFLIPIISLFKAATPWNGNVINFGLLFLPIFACILGIRFYVQRWVMYKSERGIHLVGGLLLTATWWVFIIGCIYTFIRKKVPYLPTPKEDKERSSWKILVPNLVVAIISVGAAIYGLSIDFTPFSMFMAGFALLNALFMSYTLVFAYEKQKPIKQLTQPVTESKSLFNSIKSNSFKLWRKAALPVVAVFFLVSGFQFYYNDYIKWEGSTAEIQDKPKFNYLGIFLPKKDNGISNLKAISSISNEIDKNFDIISLYLAWDQDMDKGFPKTLLDSIYEQKSIPMLTWEPWLTNFDTATTKNKHVFSLIKEGYFDYYLKDFALRLKRLERPVFIRFAHEFDNPFYPWYSKEEHANTQFKDAWRYVYEIFKQQQANNVIWVWNPWTPDNVATFYPGKEYVDWIGVNILNYYHHNSSDTPTDFKDLYQPFHEEFKGLTETPVMISEFGCLNHNREYQNNWFNKAYRDIKAEFQEIRSLVYFNSNVDDNWPSNSQGEGYLDWTIANNKLMKNSLGQKKAPDYILGPLPPLTTNKQPEQNMQMALKNIKGINLKKGHDWNKDYHILDRRNLLWDFDQFISLGINTIKYIDNNIYDYNVLTISKEKKLNISYGFWIPENLDFVNDSVGKAKLAKHILRKIEKHKHQDHIVSWNLLNDVLYRQGTYFNKPESLYQKKAYIIWLKQLVKDIKNTDNQRPLTIDLEVNGLAYENIKLLTDLVPNWDGLGLVIKEDHFLTTLTSYLKKNNIPYIYSDISVEELSQFKDIPEKVPYFITAWQDQHQSNKVNFQGLIDRKKKHKADFYKLRQIIKKTKEVIPQKKVAILKPANLLYDHQTQNYQAMVYDSIKGWTPGQQLNNLKFEWALVKCDSYGNFLSIKEVGDGPELSLEIPEKHELYRLHLAMIHDNKISSSITELHTPLLQDKNIKTDQITHYKNLKE
ncbi:glycosyltransferase [Arenibacter aquaticus]|uniref:Glycosyltransferase n=1 Tax=Arenibacter aquaticus TaxID=2489054 RepID=A0A3S0BVV6_9FLAO|nr:glycosyltransferase family 2 protein [Arenibacter aquaticus]RTE52813.1 glycosyltransferase [Arenibacter aquaticus]